MGGLVRDWIIWLGFKPKKLKVFTIKDGLISNSITSIHGMKDNQLLIGTNRGLSIMHIPSGTFTTFLKKDGLPSEEFEIGVDHDIEKNEFFLATTKGVVSFFYGNLRPFPYTHLTLPTNLRVDSDSGMRA